MGEVLKEIGYIIRQERKLKGWSQETLAVKIGIDQASVSRIEQGYPGISFSLYKKALLGVKLCYSKNPGVYHQLLPTVYHHFDTYAIKELKEEFCRIKKDYISFSDFPDFLLCEAYVYAALRNVPLLEKAVGRIGLYESLFEGANSLHAFHIQGIYHLYQHQPEQALPYLEKACQFCDMNGIEDALVYFHHAACNYVLLNHTASILSIEKAKKIYLSENNSMRLTGLEYLTGLIHLNDGNYDEALSLLSSCRGNKVYISDPVNHYSITRSLGLTYFFKKQYEEALFYLEPLLKDNLNQDILFFSYLAAKMLGNKEKTAYYAAFAQTRFSAKQYELFTVESMTLLYNQEIETVIGRSNLYLFAKWLLDNAAGDIYRLRKYTVYKNTFDIILKMKVEKYAGLS